jgi:hypothetical protein
MKKLMHKTPFIAALLALTAHTTEAQIQNRTSEAEIALLGSINPSFNHTIPTRENDHNEKLAHAEEYIQQIEDEAFGRLYRAGLDEMGDESDIDVEKESSPAQSILEYLITDGSLRGLFTHKITGIRWNNFRIMEDAPEISAINGDLGKYKMIAGAAYYMEGESRLLGYPKFKRRLTDQPFREKRAIGGDTGNAVISAYAKNAQNITRIGFRNNYACKSHEACEKMLRRQFSKAVSIEPITGYCRDYVGFERQTLGFILYRYYKISMNNRHVFLGIYANEDDGGSRSKEEGYTVFNFYPVWDAENAFNCLPQYFRKKYPLIL